MSRNIENAKYFEKGKHYNRSTKVKDIEIHGGAKFAMSHFANEDDTQPYSIITVDTGSCHLHVVITAAEARDLAANLQAHADELEAHQAQYALDEVAA